MRYSLTGKQVEIMSLIRSRNTDDTLLDLTQLRLGLSYTATKQAVLCSVNHLVKRGLIERTAQETRLGYRCTTLDLTDEGSVLLNNYAPSLKSILIESEGLENILNW